MIIILKIIFSIFIRFLDGVDANNSYAIYGQDVAVVASKASGSTQPPIASSKAGSYIIYYINFQ